MLIIISFFILIHFLSCEYKFFDIFSFFHVFIYVFHIFLLFFFGDFFCWVFEKQKKNCFLKENTSLFFVVLFLEHLENILWQFLAYFFKFLQIFFWQFMLWCLKYTTYPFLSFFSLFIWTISLHFYKNLNVTNEEFWRSFVFFSWNFFNEFIEKNLIVISKNK